jgi:predicted ATPase/class 3 adenylate cyclase
MAGRRVEDDTAEVAVNLPAGMVTFVFTDIEGSTRLFRRLGDAYPPVLERHNALLREAWATNHGVEVKTEGDAFFVAFGSASDAVAACVQGQRLLGAEPWPKDVGLRVRMGIHTGLAAPRNGDYVAFAVHQAARVVGSAHGGQIIVSPEALNAAGPVPLVTFASLGRYRLRDFDRPVEIHQVVAAGLDRAFPALRAIPAQGHNLTRPQSSFVGRQTDLDRVRALLSENRVVSLVGPGGMGKTRLATEVGLTVADQWPDGVWMVALAPLQNGDLVAGVLAVSLGVSAGSVDPLDAVVEHLRERKALLLFDNSEHLIQAAALVVARIIDECPWVTILTTSREPLGLDAEVVWRPAPLEPGGAAATLFLDRARAADARYTPGIADLTVIAEICRRLDGLPLAIELAASRVGKLSPAEILAGLENRFRLLRSSRRDLAERQRTLTALLDWSYDLLTETEQAVFRRLGVFVASFSLAAAEAAASSDDGDSLGVAEVVWSLVDKSLLVRDPSESESRYRMLDTVRAYALDRLHHHGEAERAARDVTTWLLRVAGPRPVRDPQWLHSARVEADNIRGLIELIAGTDSRRALELACSIALLHDSESTYRQGTPEVDRYVTLLVEPCAQRLALLGQLGYLQYLLRGPVAPTVIGEIAVLLEAGISEPEWSQGRVRTLAWIVAIQAKDYDEGLHLATTALQDNGLPLVERARWCSLLGHALVGRGQLAAALPFFKESASLVEQVQDPRLLGASQSALAEVQLRLGNLQEAARCQVAGLEVAEQFGLPLYAAHAFVIAARMSEVSGRNQDAAVLQTVADRVLTDLGAPLDEQDRQICDDMVARARAALGDELYGKAVREGHNRSIAGAIELAREVLHNIAGGPRATGES